MLVLHPGDLMRFHLRHPVIFLGSAAGRVEQNEAGCEAYVLLDDVQQWRKHIFPGAAMSDIVFMLALVGDSIDVIPYDMTDYSTVVIRADEAVG